MNFRKGLSVRKELKDQREYKGRKKENLIINQIKQYIMIKIIVHVTKVILAVITTLLVSSCSFTDKNGSFFGSEHVSGSGNVVTQNRDVTQNFSYISAKNGLRVYVEQGSKTSITVEADDNLQEHIITEIEDDELVIYTDANIDNAEAKRITVTLPEIKGLAASSSALLKSNSVLKSETLNLSTSSGSNLNVAVEANNVTCESSSGSRMTVQGNTAELTTDSSSGSNLDAKGLTAKYVTSESSSGSHVAINPSKSLEAKASSGSHISYKNVPKQIKVKTSSGGSINEN